MSSRPTAPNPTGRREFLKHAVFGVALGGIALGGAPGSAFAAELFHPGFLFHPLGPGAHLGLGWRLDAVYPPHEGAITLTVAHQSGRSARIDVCLIDATTGVAKGPAHTALLDFIVMDGGDGTAPMDESLGRVVRRLAAVAADNESGSQERIASLSSHAERAWAHPASMAVASTQLLPGAARG